MSADTGNAESCILHKNINTKTTNLHGAQNAKAPRKQRTGFAKLHARTTCNETNSDKHHKCIWCSSHVTAKRKKRKSKRVGQTIAADSNDITHACTCERGDVTVKECISELVEYHEALSVLESSSTDSDFRNENNIVTDINGHQIEETSAHHESSTADVTMVSTTGERCFEDNACQGNDAIMTKLACSPTRSSDIEHHRTHHKEDALLNGHPQLSSTLDNSQQQSCERDVNGNEVGDKMSCTTTLAEPQVNATVTNGSVGSTAATLQHDTTSTHETSIVKGEEDDIVRDANTSVSISVFHYDVRSCVEKNGINICASAFAHAQIRGCIHAHAITNTCTHALMLMQVGMCTIMYVRTCTCSHSVLQTNT